MRTRKGIKHKTRSKRGKLLNSRKGKHRRRLTFKKLKGGGWFSWKKKMEQQEPSTLGILGKGLGVSSRTTARTVSKAMGLVTETAERSVELTGASVNLGLNITHGTVDTTNLAFLAVNKVFQKCLNLIIKGFDETYSQISQCEEQNYKHGSCVATCITPIMNKFKKGFDERRKEEYDNLTDCIKETQALIEKGIEYFCTRGLIYGKNCSQDLKSKKFEAQRLYLSLNLNVKQIKVKEDEYATNTLVAINSGKFTTCSQVKPLCIEYIERLCTPLKQLEGIKDSLKVQEDLLLSWNEKIEDFKQESDLKSFLEQFKIDRRKFDEEKEKRIKQQKQKQEEKIKKVVGILTKSSEIDICEREIILFDELIEKRKHLESSILTTEQDKILLTAALDKINKTINAIKDGSGRAPLNIELLQIKSDLKLAEEELKTLQEELENTKEKIIEFIDTQKKILGNSVSEYNVVEELRKKITEIDDKQKQEAVDAAAAAVAAAAETEAGDVAVAAANNEVKAAGKAAANNAARVALKKAANKAALNKAAANQAAANKAALNKAALNKGALNKAALNKAAANNAARVAANKATYNPLISNVV